MAKHYLVDGTVKEVSPKNGTDFKLDELKSFIGGGYIETVFFEDKILVCDEEGKLKGFPVNDNATDIYRLAGFDDYIVGDVLICNRGEIQ